MEALYLTYIMARVRMIGRNIEELPLRHGGFALRTGMSPSTRRASTRLAMRSAATCTARAVWCRPAEFLVIQAILPQINRE